MTREALKDAFMAGWFNRAGLASRPAAVTAEEAFSEWYATSCATGERKVLNYGIQGASMLSADYAEAEQRFAALHLNEIKQDMAEKATQVRRADELARIRKSRDDRKATIARKAMEMNLPRPDTVDRFTGYHRFLSNFYPAPVTFENVLFPTVEHAYQAAKSPEHNVWTYIATLENPKDAKRFGATVRLRPDWEDAKLGVMEYLLRQKFADPKLGRMLKATAPMRLVEGNTWGDTFWGVCNGEGQNWLGEILELIRDGI